MENNSILDTFSEGTKTELTEEEYIEKLEQYVQASLNKTFPESRQKRTIYKYKDRINFACPLCGDSASDPYKKRGNIILRGRFANIFKCHNCGLSMPVDRFLKTIKVGEISQTVIKKVRKSLAETAQRTVDASVSTADMLFYMPDIEEISVTREDLKRACRLQECDGSEGYNNGKGYLDKRLQFDYKKFLYDTESNRLFLLNLTPEGKIFGLQTRELSQRRVEKYGKYKTYPIAKIHSYFLKDDIDENDELKEKCMEYEGLSMIFGALLVDYGKDVYVTEGPMDSLMVQNCIALCGGSKSAQMSVEVKYIFDSDASGVKYAIEQLKKGNYVFMWKKYLKDNGFPERKKWDINDLVLYCNENRMRMPDIRKYFTNDSFDALLL